MTILETIKEKSERVKNGTNKSVSMETIRQHHSDKSFKEIGQEIDRLLTNGQIYESEPARVCHI